jgi:CBS domain-containing protein
MRLCTDSRIRHLPVVQGDKVIGVISIGDLVKAVIDAQAEQIEHLQRYITS